MSHRHDSKPSRRCLCLRPSRNHRKGLSFVSGEKDGRPKPSKVSECLALKRQKMLATRQSQQPANKKRNANRVSDN